MLWRDVPIGMCFNSFDESGNLIHAGIKTGSTRYFSFKYHAISGFCDNRSPDDMECLISDYPDKLIWLLQRQIHYLYHNASEDLKEHFDNDFPDNELINGIMKFKELHL